MTIFPGGSKPKNGKDDMMVQRIEAIVFTDAFDVILCARGMVLGRKFQQHHSVYLIDGDKKLDPTVDLCIRFKDDMPLETIKATLHAWLSLHLPTEGAHDPMTSVMESVDRIFGSR